MCKYCEENKINANHNGNDLRVVGGYLDVRIYDDEMYRCSTSFQINYCPMCGKELRTYKI